MSPHGPFDVCVVSHTHWDREWYLPFARFRQRLVALVDELLDAPSPDAPFLLDGQGVLLDDYLDVRADREQELRVALQRGALEAGPWYVLADELLTSGEGLVRNLLEGGRTVRARGGRPLPVLYCPDSFGHPADLPTLAQGFGLPLIILWRGLGGPARPAGDAFQWRAPGGATALVHHLPPNGYEYGANLPPDEDETRARWTALRALLAPRARTRTLLLLNGADHHARQSRPRDAVEALARTAAPDQVRATGLREFAASFVEGARAMADLPEIEGELRFSPGYTWTVPGTWSTRAYQKRRNAQVERLLTREAEPWAALAAARGGAQRAPLLRAAWRTLLRCHPHDTLCGCSIDEVAAAADERFRFAEREARGIVDDAVADLVGHDAATAHETRTWHPQLLVRNPAARARRGVAEIEIIRFIAHEPVGPGSAGVAIEDRQLPAPALDGGRIPLQVLARRTSAHRVESPRHYPDNDRVDVSRCVAWIDEVGGYGIAAVPIRDGGSTESREKATAPVRRVDCEARMLDNGLLRVMVDGEGRIALESAAARRVVSPLIRFEDVGDAGDLYTHSPIEPILRDVRLDRIRLKHAGPLRGELWMRLAMGIPAASDRGGRSRELVENEIAIALILDAGSPFLRVVVRGANHARDHRLRIVFATDVRDGVTRADAMFGPVTRERREQPADTRSMEVVPYTAPLARWVSRQGATHGMTLISDGLGEYEVLSDGAIAVTLVRAVGSLSRNDIPERPGHAGWPVPTPTAQMPGPYRAEFALLPHVAGGDEAIVEVERLADDVLVPLRGTTLRSATRPLESVHGVSLDGRGLRFLACKPSEDGEWTVLRCVNVTSRPVSGSWRCGWAVREARASRLDELPGEVHPVRGGGVIEISVAPLAVTTILVR